MKFVRFGVNGTSFLKDIHKKQVVKNRVQKKDKKVPSPSSKIAQDFRPRSSRPNQRILSSIFRKKRKISAFGVNGTSYLQDIQRKKRKPICKKKKKW